MNATQIAACVQMPRSSAVARLNALIELGLIERIERKYYLESNRAANVPTETRLISFC